MTKTIVERNGDQSHVLYLKKSGFGYTLDFVTLFTWKELDSNSFIIVGVPIELDEYPPCVAASRAKSDLMYCLTAASPTETKIEFLFSLEASMVSQLPKTIVNLLMLDNSKRSSHAQQYFQELRELVDLDDVDARAMGEVIFLAKGKGKGKGGGESVREVIKQHASLRLLDSRYSWFGPFIDDFVSTEAGMSWVMGEERFDERLRLELLRSDDAVLLAEALRLNVMSYGNEKEAVDVFLSYKAMADFESEYPFFHTFLDTIVQLQITSVSWMKIQEVSNNTNS